MSQELNEKIARWRGFEWIVKREHVLRRGWVEGHWQAPVTGHSKRLCYLPNFTI